MRLSGQHYGAGLARGAARAPARARNIPRVGMNLARGWARRPQVACAAVPDDENTPAGSASQPAPASTPPPEPVMAAAAVQAPAAAAGPGPAAASSAAPAATASTNSGSHHSNGSSSGGNSGGGGGQPTWQPSAERTARRVERLKAREAAEVDALCSQLEGLGGPVALAAPAVAAGAGGSAAPFSTTTSSSSSGPSSPAAAADLLAGTWRLVYSSGFNSGSLGGRRPGPPAAGFPATLGQVYQRIDPATAKLDNIVELLLSPPPPLAALGSLGGLLGEGLGGLVGGLPAGPLRDAVSPLAGALAGGARVPAPDASRESPAARLTLRHDYEVTPPSGVRICYEETYAELVGADLFAQLPRLEAPQLPEPLRPPKFLRSATFEVTYLDAGGQMRITRGDRGELRVYLRDTDPDPAAGGSGSGSSGRGAAGAMALDYED
ncbi:hypothetical protein HYH02_006646 [Chlamydomonas schloesseri]|uniref:Plastid lipid-associated protein/fibrillin conserved domain-containing protein n=1 Tax=Chlamydomonas schloesseri TaxID=2026947 RepID=A0A835W0G8_9CHLO|nr:hypothetical protein HYH02_006646 [Chlamydomonas schloesseri]|eukprot:KAG2432658.1 hypothetical protein HYH02_006646 [Chlamydomonas schloesseri]